MKTSTSRWGAVLAVLVGTSMVHAAATDPPAITYTGDGSDLQEVIDAAPTGVTITFDAACCLEVSKSITVRRSLALSGLNARLPQKLGRTPIVIVAAEGVTLSGLELQGNYDSVSQDDRAPLIHVTKGRFKAKRCVFRDASKDGIMVEPERSAGDIVDVVVRDIEAHRMGRDAVSISGGNRGQRVRNVLVENVRLQRGYFRGAVEVSDGTDSVTVRHVCAEDAVYAIDVQDHGTASAPNTNVLLEEVTAVNCKHVIRTANSKIKHANLTLRKFTAADCKQPVKISNTTNVVIEDLTITNRTKADSARVRLDNCHGVRLGDIRIRGLAQGVEPIVAKNCTDVKIGPLTRSDE